MDTKWGKKKCKFGWWKRCKTRHQKNAKLDEKVGVNNGARFDTSRHKKMVQKGAYNSLKLDAKLGAKTNTKVDVKNGSKLNVPLDTK